jgi:hypothetical protein
MSKAITTIDIVDASEDLLTPVATLVIIDADRLEREVLRDSIADADVQKLLPFFTDVSAGDNYFHIVNSSAYTVETNSHQITEGQTLCNRGEGPGLYATCVTPTCPGCLAKAKAIIVNHLLTTL